MSEPRLLTGWGRTAPTAARFSHVKSAELAIEVATENRRGILARGWGRSYGDAAQNAGGRVVSLPADGALAIDAATAEVVVDAGVGFDRLIRDALPFGLFPPVTPGTRFVTVGGAVASDVHGKNHHRDGSIGSHVRWIRLLDGQGNERVLTPEGTPDLFWATVGGMGLTGIVLEVGLRMRRVETAHIRADLERLPNLERALEAMGAGDQSTYSVAWIDLLARGASLGRSVLMSGEHATRDELEGAQRASPLVLKEGQIGRIPFTPPFSAVGRGSVRAFNALYYGRAPREPRRVVQPLTSFFHPLDVMGEWNRLYGPRGFTQYQFVLPLGAERELRDIVVRLAGSGHSSFLAVLKRMGPGDPGPLSFPIEGWTLALDLPVRPGVGPLLDDLDGIVASAGGRIYLAKDARAKPEMLRRMYPRLGDFQNARKALDPHGVFQSDLARRLEL